ncbi:hypothetical protein [Streptomyces hirsutus]|uniref:hypothetical protein n=1 Tax=Streptomyces hirsutus TaxID=35620 RepID=UPI003686040F
MPRYTYGGNPSAVLTTASGAVVPNYPVTVRVAGTGQIVTALYEMNGTPIAQLRANPADSDQPGAVRSFQIDDVPQIEYEYNGQRGPVRWYEAGREVAQQALSEAQSALSGLDSKLDKAGGTLTGPLTVGGFHVDSTGVITANGLVLPSDSVSQSKAIIIKTPTGPDTYPVWRAPKDGLVVALHGYRVGGTGATVNARRNGVDLAPIDLSLSTANTWLSAPNLTGTEVAAGDTLSLAVRSVTGAPTSVTLQIDLQGA